MMLRRKKSSSWDNLAALSLYADHNQAYCYKDQSEFKQRKNSLTLFSPRLKSSLVVRRSSTLGRCTRMNSGGLVDDIDSTLADIKQKLAMFREQDMKLRKRMNSLSSSIEDLTPSSSSPTPSDPAEVVPDVIPADDATEEKQYKDDHTIENEIKTLSESFSRDVFNHLPSIAVTCYRTMYASDPSLHKTVKHLT